MPAADLRGHIWAPDISYHDGKYYLYYSVWAFGKNTSCIGLDTNVTLDPDSPEFRWVDHGKIIQSFPGLTNWNAIDPNIIADENGTSYMSFGSFWDGLKMVRLTPDRMSLAEDWQDLPTIASRKPDPDELNRRAGRQSSRRGQQCHRGAVHLSARQSVLPVCLERLLLPRGQQHVQDDRGPIGVGDGTYLDREGRPLARGGGNHRADR